MLTKPTKNYLLTECILFFALLPPLIAVLKPRGWMYGLLWGATLLSCWWLHHNKYHIKDIWNKEGLSRDILQFMLKLFIPLSLVLLLFTYFAIPERLFSLPLERPVTWVMVLILYPVLSVFPQEILYRSFFIRRYRLIFPSDKAMIAASALAFGWVHILLLNWVAVVFSAVGGVIFARTYLKSRSLAAVCLEHALYGCMVFTLGLGYYFYHGNAVR